MAGVAEEIEEATSSVKGVYCEPKGPSVAVHFRKVPLRQRPEVDRALLRILVRHHPRVILARGLQVVEARLRLPVSKGTAVRRICRDLPESAAVLYFGDDETDRDAFREVVGRGWRVAIGGLSGPADYTLPGPDAVIEVLEALSRLTSNVPGPGGDRNPSKSR